MEHQITNESTMVKKLTGFQKEKFITPKQATTTMLNCPCCIVWVNLLLTLHHVTIYENPDNYQKINKGAKYANSQHSTGNSFFLSNSKLFWTKINISTIHHNQHFKQKD